MKKAILLFLLCSTLQFSFAQIKLIFPSTEQLEKVHSDRLKSFRTSFQTQQPVACGRPSADLFRIQSRNGKIEKLDEIVQYGYDRLGNLDPVYRDRFHYNDENQLTSSESSDNYSTGQMTPSSRTEYSYNPVGQCTSYYTKYWNQYIESWINSSRYLLLYNEKGNIVEDVFDFYTSETESWHTYWKNTYSFSPDGLITENVTYVNNYFTSGLEERYKTKFAYNRNRDLVLVEEFIREDSLSGWVLSHKIENIYDENRRIIQQLLYNKQIDELELYFRVFRIYDLDGYLLFIKGQRLEGPAWQPAYEYKFTYDEMGRVISYEDNYQWDPFYRQWQYRYKATRVYNDFDDITQENSFKWDLASALWIDDDQLNLHYDIDIDVTDIALPRVPQITDEAFLNTRNKLLGASLSSYDPEYSQWFLSDSFSLIYSITIAAENIHFAPNMIYPNPATDQIMIDLNDITTAAELEIFSLHGQLLMKTSIKPGQYTSLRQVADGMHVYKIKNGNTTYTGKLIVMH